jgi:hypothetical protein
MKDRENTLGIEGMVIAIKTGYSGLEIFEKLKKCRDLPGKWDLHWSGVIAWERT